MLFTLGNLTLHLKNISLPFSLTGLMKFATFVLSPTCGCIAVKSLAPSSFCNVKIEPETDCVADPEPASTLVTKYLLVLK